MKYKYRREKLAKLYFDYEDKCDFLEDLLAQKEDKKECKHKFSSKDCRCFYCGKEITSGTGGNSTTSPLEGFVKIKEIDYMEHDLNPNKKTFDQDAQNWFADLEEKVNQLISNQKKLYQYIKEKQK